MRFLIVESDQQYAAHLKKMIEACCEPGVVVDHVSTVPGALTQIHARYYDLCILEYHLDTSATGLEVLKSLRNFSVLTAFVFLTDHANKEAAFEALTLGAMDYLIKERFTQFELAKCIAYSMYLKRREVGLQKEALEDSLTGLGNKGLFEAQLQQAAARAQRDDEKLGLLVIDVDGFKGINDKYGHKVGDQLLQQIAERIVNETRSSDVIARIGGDEFAAILIKPKSADQIYSVREKIEKALASTPYNTSGAILKVSASVGSAILPDDSLDLDDLFTMADQRMYDHKKLKKVALRSSRDYMDQVLR
ncbi:diguanylate cyclase [Pseudomonadota bacterium]